MGKLLGKIGQVEKEGNTEPLSRAHRKTFYCFTAYYSKETDIDVLKEQLGKCSKKYLFGREICPTTGRHHLQGFIHLLKPMRITELKLINSPHLEACVGSEEQNEKYCSKDGNVFRFGYPRPIKVIENLYPWQQNIETISRQEPDDRKIFWFWESKGNIGKSAFVKYMIVKHNALFCDGGKKSDLINLVFNADMDKCNCLIWDLPRSSKGHISYATLEAVKNGTVCNTKYETGVKVFNPPHIFVFANFPPENPEELSEDRWIITEL
nr:MAG: replication associated protein [Cressdnaviricota sp.]